MTSRMFPFITHTANPLGGRCPYQCIYDWAQGPKGLVNRYNMEKYRGPARLFENVLKKRYKKGDFVFSVDMTDPNHLGVTDEMKLRIYEWYQQSPETMFLELSKNPMRHVTILEYLREHGYEDFTPNLVLGATIESNRKYPSISKAPPQDERLYWMIQLSDMTRNKLFISIEPILDFDLDEFALMIQLSSPWAVAVGYDNYNHRLPEPPLAKTLQLIEELEKFTTIYRKTLREAWNK